MKGHTEQHRFRSFAKGLLAGVVTGAVVAFFLAPRSGAETRKQLHQHGQLLREQAGDAVIKTRTTVEEVVGKRPE